MIPNKSRKSSVYVSPSKILVSCVVKLPLKQTKRSPVWRPDSDSTPHTKEDAGKRPRVCGGELGAYRIRFGCRRQ